MCVEREQMQETIRHLLVNMANTTESFGCKKPMPIELRYCMISGGAKNVYVNSLRNLFVHAARWTKRCSEQWHSMRVSAVLCEWMSYKSRTGIRFRCTFNARNHRHRWYTDIWYTYTLKWHASRSLFLCAIETRIIEFSQCQTSDVTTNTNKTKIFMYKK